MKKYLKKYRQSQNVSTLNQKQSDFILMKNKVREPSEMLHQS